MGRLSKALLISLIYTMIVITLDAVAIYYFKLNAPITVIVTTFLVSFHLVFEFLDATRRIRKELCRKTPGRSSGGIIFDYVECP